jgi:release factor glutamine methyltransferase
MKGTWTVLAALDWTAAYFKEKGCLSPRLDAELLLCHCLGLERIQLYVQFERPLDMEERAEFRALVARRGRGEPVQYLLGEQEFWSLPFRVTPGVLIPRADTEVLVEEALKEASRLAPVYGEALRIAEVGVGSGAVTAALATELPASNFVAGDISATALDIAQQNLKANSVLERCQLVAGNGLPPLRALSQDAFHLVVSNPPYIREDAMAGLMREVRDHEPHEALVAGPDGLLVIRQLVAEAAHANVLLEGGALLLEIGSRSQADAVSQLMSEAGFTQTRVRDDYAGHARIVVGVFGG